MSFTGTGAGVAFDSLLPGAMHRRSGSDAKASPRRPVHGVPVIANPVGGVVEQVADGRTGVVASAIGADSLAEAIRRLARDGDLYRTISAALVANSEERSMGAFLSQLYVCLAELHAADSGPLAASAA